MRIKARLRETGISVESELLEAIRLAKNQGAIMWEWRATTDLVSIVPKSGKPKEAERMLDGVISRLPSKLDTPEIISANHALALIRRTIEANKPGLGSASGGLNIRTYAGGVA